MADFRIRKTGNVYYVWQFVGGRYHRLCYPHASRTDAQAWIKSIT